MDGKESQYKTINFEHQQIWKWISQGRLELKKNL